MRRLFAFAAAALLLAAGGHAVADAAGAAVQSDAARPALTGRVVDLADLLSPGEEAYLVERLAALEARTTDQLVIATVPSLGGRSIDDYSLALFNRWGLGQADKDNGVLLLVAPAERQVRIQVGHGLERILTDARARAIVDSEILPQFQQSRWYEGIRGGARAIIGLLVQNEREPRRGRP